jgi:predicted lysophospholipase L1 biosynthesis ABC-type transport system permease subunit
VIYQNDWAAIDNKLDSFAMTTQYKMNRAVDSMLSITSVFLAIGVMIVYASENLRDKRRDVALLQSLGGDGGLIAKTQFAELIFLIILSSGILALYSPLFVSNSRITTIGTFTSWSF